MDIFCRFYAMTAGRCDLGKVTIDILPDDVLLAITLTGPDVESAAVSSNHDSIHFQRSLDQNGHVGAPISPHIRHQHVSLFLCFLPLVYCFSLSFFKCKTYRERITFLPVTTSS